MQFDPAAAELHNLVVRDAKVRTRRGLTSAKTPTAGSNYVAGFSVQSQSTTEFWHYLFEQSSTTSVVTLQVTDEEFGSIFSLPLGPMQARPIVTKSVALNQILINSPSFTGPLYGLVGGGLIPAIKSTSTNPDTRSLDIPPGHITAWGDRSPIAFGSTLYINDPPNPDPRAYVAANAIPLGGTIYDLFTGPEGALYLFTSADTYTIAADALGKGQTATGFISTLTGLNPLRPGNAATSNGVVACLTKDGLVTVANGVQTRVPLTTYQGKRYLSLPYEQNDFRDGRLFSTTNGFLLSFGTKRKHVISIDVRNGFRSVLWTQTGAPLDVVGMLKTRDGEDLPVLSNRVVQYMGTSDFDGSAVRGVACQRIDVPTQQSAVVRSVTVKADNVGQPVAMAVGAATRNNTTPTKTRDITIGTSLWAASGQLNGREQRTTRMQCDERVTDLEVEVALDGGDRSLGLVDVEVQGQGATRRDRF